MPRTKRPQTPDFSPLLATLDRELADCVQESGWVTLVGIQVRDLLGEAADAVRARSALALHHGRMAGILKRSVRHRTRTGREPDAFMPMGDVYYVVFPGTSDDLVQVPIQRILQRWHDAAEELAVRERLALDRTLAVGVASWHPSRRQVQGQELLAFCTMMIDQATGEDGPSDRLLPAGEGSGQVHSTLRLATFRWL
ncbi:MAG: hypothetical protein VKP57_05980 [Candidatus Sericytochromatia bacterium]|nr:hypothetical protein [Candidatus Sericytochromatia bacterium]